jgi:serine/threonine-protein phosphatase 5
VSPLLAAGKYTHAVTAYSEALENSPSAVLFANRAAAHLKLETYGSAIADAEAAMRLDPTYLKAWYRRGSARLALSRFKEARKDFAYVCAARPDDKDARAKLGECEKQVKQKAFLDAIATEEGANDLSATLAPSSLAVGPEYTGPRLPAIPGEGAASSSSSPSSASTSSSSSDSSSSSAAATPSSPRGAASGAASVAASSPEACAADESAVNKWGVSLGFVKALISDFKGQRLLHKRYTWELLIRAKKLLAGLPSLVHAPIPEGATRVNVCGDTHGQFYDTVNIFALCGFPSPTNPYVFNGDFVDRGSFSVENVLTLLALKLLYPDAVHLLRGNVSGGGGRGKRRNGRVGPPSRVCCDISLAHSHSLSPPPPRPAQHETKNMNMMYGFTGEVKAKYDTTTMNLFTEVFHALPLALCVDRRALVLHGGLFQQDGVTLEDIARIDRFREPPESGLMSDLLWSDPQPFPGRGPSKRGMGQSFGPDITARFLAANGLDVLIRSHEVKDDGYVVEHGGKCITVFSAVSRVGWGGVGWGGVGWGGVGWGRALPVPSRRPLALTLSAFLSPSPPLSPPHPPSAPTAAQLLRPDGQQGRRGAHPSGPLGGALLPLLRRGPAPAHQAHGLRERDELHVRTVNDGGMHGGRGIAVAKPRCWGWRERGRPLGAHFAHFCLFARGPPLFPARTRTARALSPPQGPESGHLLSTAPHQARASSARAPDRRPR